MKKIQILHDGKMMFLKEIAKLTGINYYTLAYRVKKYNSIYIEDLRYKRDDIKIDGFVFTSDKKEDIRKLREMKCTFRQIGELLGVTRQRIHQILNK
jgi:hypothetical protein